MVNKPSVPIKPPKPVPASRYGDFEKLFMLFIFIRKISNVIQILYLYVDYLRLQIIFLTFVCLPVIIFISLIEVVYFNVFTA